MILKDKNKLKRVKIEEQDERHLLMTYKAGYISMGITVMALYLSSFYLALMNLKVLIATITIMAVLLIVYMGSYLILKKFY